MADSAEFRRPGTHTKVGRQQALRGPRQLQFLAAASHLRLQCLGLRLLPHTSTRTMNKKIYYYRCLGSDDYRDEHGRVCATSRSAPTTSTRSSEIRSPDCSPNRS